MVNTFSFLLTILFDKITDSKLLVEPFAWVIYHIDQVFEKRFALKVRSMTSLVVEFECPVRTRSISLLRPGGKIL